MFYTKQVIGVLFIILLCNLMTAQQYDDYIGYGHNAGIQVQSSNSTTNNSDDKILTGSNLLTDQEGASRFLRQATMGSNYEAINSTSQTGLTNWLNTQFALTPISFASEYQRIYNEANFIITGNVGAPIVDDNEFLPYVFYEMGVKQPDVLRQKVAFSLSQIFVISPANDVLRNRGFSCASYYEILYQGAFGNFRDLLFDVTMHPSMGLYLSHFQNKKADLVQGLFPDENFAREIMQLFTIGLHELNQDGSLIQDANGELIPTYDNEDIQELAKVFTGLSGAINLTGTPSVFGSIVGAYDLSLPMKMFQNYHDSREKILIDGTILPANQAGMDDINQAIDVLFNHDNVAPFFSLRMIQHLVKSNPSPQYINRISSIFNNNGNGVRGDIGAVIRGILLDPEARDCAWITDPTAGKLTQPIERITNLLFGFDVQTPSNKFWFWDLYDVHPRILQAFQSSPSVFNFFSPFYAEKDFVQPNGLVSPEFQILNSSSGIHYLNTIENMLKLRPFGNRTKLFPGRLALDFNFDDDPYFDFSDELNLYDPNDNSTLDLILDRLDLILCSGQMKAENKVIIKNSIIQQRINFPSFSDQQVLIDMIYYIMISPDYTILK